MLVEEDEGESKKFVVFPGADEDLALVGDQQALAGAFEVRGCLAVVAAVAVVEEFRVGHGGNSS